MMEILQDLLGGHGQERLCNGFQVSLPLADHLFEEHAPFAVVGAQFRAVEAGRPQHHRETCRQGPSPRDPSGWQAPAPPAAARPCAPCKRDHVDAKRLGDLRDAMAEGRPHPPPDISLDGLAVRTH